MPGKKSEGSRIVSVRLPDDLIERLDRYLDWSECSRRMKSSRNAAIREALSSWLDEHEQLAGFVAPQAQREQFQSAYRSIATGHDWAAIPRLRQLLPWPRERFDTVLEGLRANGQVELESAKPSELSPQVLQDSYDVHGHLYLRLRWRDGSDGSPPRL